FLAKIASDLNKPNGMAIILPEEAEAFIEQLPVKKIHGIGKVTAAKMERLGIRTGGDLKKWSELDLIRRFGKSGRWYYRIARGDDQRRVRPDRIRKSVGAERTFSEDLHEREDLQERLNFVVEEVARRLHRIQTRGRTITLKLKSKDFELSTRSRTLDFFTADEKLIRKITTELLDSPYPEKPLRLIGVSLSNLDTDKRTHGEQLSFIFK
ncbi:MAG: DNA polymerase IV, partial [Bacteroidota bacterium]